jgi:hypothetical protein
MDTRQAACPVETKVQRATTCLMRDRQRQLDRNDGRPTRATIPKEWEKSEVVTVGARSDQAVDKNVTARVAIRNVGVTSEGPDDRRCVRTGVGVALAPVGRTGIALHLVRYSTSSTMDHRGCFGATSCPRIQCPNSSSIVPSFRFSSIQVLTIAAMALSRPAIT